MLNSTVSTQKSKFPCAAKVSSRQNHSLSQWIPEFHFKDGHSNFKEWGKLWVIANFLSCQVRTLDKPLLTMIAIN